MPRSGPGSGPGSGLAPGPTPSLRAGIGTRWLFAAPIVLAALAILAVRVLLGFQFPVPWPDETGFVAQAFDLARTGSLFDPGLNPDRVVMWMPPGYMALLAVCFRLFGYGFALARWVSTLCCLLSLALAAAIAWRFTAGWRRMLAGWVVGAAFLAPCLLIDANIARMDMLLAAMMLLSLWACLAGWIYLAAALVLAGGLVHFNAAYFAPAVLAAMLASYWRHGARAPARFECLAMALAAAGVVLYGIYIARHWDGFRADMAFQFTLKRFVSIDDPAHPLWPVLAGAALCAVAAWAGRAIPALFGLGFLIMAHSGHELWYDYGQPLGFALLAVALLAAVPAAARARWAGLAGVLAAAVLLVVQAATITPTLRPLLPRPEMLRRDVIAADQITRVRHFIAGLPPGATVNFGWSGMEPFFFADLARAGAHWTIIRHSVTQVWPLRRYDWRVRCDSSEWPKLALQFDIDYPRSGLDTGCDIIRPAQAAP